MMNNKKTAVYSRISSINTSFDIQLEAAKPHLEGIPEEDILYFKDINVQSSSKRESFDKLLDLIAQDQIDTLIVYSMDRLTRKQNEILGIFELVQTHKVNVIFTADGHFPLKQDLQRDSSSGVLIALLAEIEKEYISKRLEAAIRIKKSLKKINNVNS
ncbi:recombinase family protein [Mesobacillus jeotgali]|uniref:recombinase family protein n=1 Tax=Mesobacillus jeotgali TaxID=129985 RepID=UPI0009A89F7C|nr:recombinase family protein [Mesobacillus jeotgali]